MFTTLQTLAHADTAHENGMETLWHITEANPWLSALLILLLMIAIPLAVHTLARSWTVTILVTLLELFLVGVLTYTVVPLVAAISITLGFVLALLLVFVSIGE